MRLPGLGEARGFTLLEITIILAVIAIIGLILTPSVISFISSSRLARARADVDALGNSVLEFYRDNGFFPKYADPDRTTTIRLLVSPGEVPRGAGPATLPWTATDPGLLDLIANQLVDNRPAFGNTGYALKTAISGAGWNGPYLNRAVESDPWGNRYAINVEFLSVNPGPTEAGGQQVKRAVWALSAGPDGIIDTVYPTATQQLITRAATATTDVGIRIQ